MCTRTFPERDEPFPNLEWVFGFVKVGFRGLKKNHDHVCAAFAPDPLPLPQTAGRSGDVVCPESTEGATLRGKTMNHTPEC